MFSDWYNQTGTASLGYFYYTNKFVASLPKAVYAVVESPEPEDYQDSDPTVTLFADRKKAQKNGLPISTSYSTVYG